MAEAGPAIASRQLQIDMAKGEVDQCEKELENISLLIQQSVESVKQLELERKALQETMNLAKVTF